MIANLLSRYWKLAVLLTLALPLSSCGVILIGGAAAGTVGYVSGELSATLNSRYELVVEATDRAISENDIVTISRARDNHLVSYELRTLNEDKVQLEVTYATRDLTNVAIRVGIFGDEPLSRQILNEIETRLEQ